MPFDGALLAVAGDDGIDVSAHQLVVKGTRKQLADARLVTGRQEGGKPFFAHDFIQPIAGQLLEPRVDVADHALRVQQQDDDRRGIKQASGEIPLLLQRLLRLIACVVIANEALQIQQLALCIENAATLFVTPTDSAGTIKHAVLQPEVPARCQRGLNPVPDALLVIGVNLVGEVALAAQKVRGRIPGQDLSALGHEGHGPVLVVTAAVDEAIEAGRDLSQTCGGEATAEAVEDDEAHGQQHCTEGTGQLHRQPGGGEKTRSGGQPVCQQVAGIRIQEQRQDCIAEHG